MMLVQLCPKKEIMCFVEIKLQMVCLYCLYLLLQLAITRHK